MPRGQRFTEAVGDKNNGPIHGIRRILAEHCGIEEEPGQIGQLPDMRVAHQGVAIVIVKIESLKGW